MKITKYLIISLFAIAGLSSCETEIDFETEMMKSKITVNAFIANDSTAEVSLSRNSSINNLGSNEIVKDAEVFLYEEEELKEQLTLKEITIANPYVHYMEGQPDSLTNYYYLSTSKTQAGKSYRIEVKDSTGETITAGTTIPQPVQISSIDTTVDLVEMGNVIEVRINFNLRFTDPENETNFYRIGVSYLAGFQSLTINDDDTIYYIQTSYREIGTNLGKDDPILSSENNDANSILFGSSGNTYNIFTDKKVNGKEIEITFYLSFAMAKEAKNLFTKDIGEFLQAKIQLHSISSDEYYYLSSIDNQEFNDLLPFVEPVSIYSNIENGNGIFAGYSVDEMEFNIGEYPMEGILYDIDTE